MKKSFAGSEGKKPSRVLATVILAINTMLITAGIGTMLGGKLKEGLIQFLLVVIGVSMGVYGFLTPAPVLAAFLVMTGVSMVLGGWIWSIVSGIVLVRKAALAAIS